MIARFVGGADPHLGHPPARRILYSRDMRLSLLLLTALLVFAAAGCSHTENVVMNSDAMDPTIAPGDVVTVDTSAYRRHDPERFDIVAYANPVTGAISDGLYVGRVVGVGGEVVEARGGSLFVNGKPLAPPATMHGFDSLEDFRVVLRSSQLFILGDNLETSVDSRTLGAIAGVYGRVIE